jgi:hypothetical protein
MTEVANGDDDDGRLVLCEHLHCDDGRCLGVIYRRRGNREAPTYAWGYAPGCADLKRIGPCSSDQAARAAVEHRLTLDLDEPRG